MGGWALKVAAFVAIVAVAWVFIAPDVDLLDSTCDKQAIMTLLLQAPAVPTAAPELMAAAQARTAGSLDLHNFAVGTEILPLTCVWTC